MTHAASACRTAITLLASLVMLEYAHTIQLGQAKQVSPERFARWVISNQHVASSRRIVCWTAAFASYASLLAIINETSAAVMANKGLAFSLGGVKKAQAVRPRPGLNKPLKAKALAAFEAPEADETAVEDVQQTKRQRLEPAGCCVFPVVFLLSF